MLVGKRVRNVRGQQTPPRSVFVERNRSTSPTAPPPFQALSSRREARIELDRASSMRGFGPPRRIRGPRSQRNRLGAHGALARDGARVRTARASSRAERLHVVDGMIRRTEVATRSKSPGAPRSRGGLASRRGRGQKLSIKWWCGWVMDSRLDARYVTRSSHFECTRWYIPFSPALRMSVERGSSKSTSRPCLSVGRDAEPTPSGARALSSRPFARGPENYTRRSRCRARAP